MLHGEVPRRASRRTRRASTARRRRAVASSRTTPIQLREKQKVKRIYGLHEKQFRNLFERAAHVPGVTGENLLVGPRDAARQHRLPHGLRAEPRRGAAAGAASSRRGERTASSTSRAIRWSAGRRDRGAGEVEGPPAGRRPASRRGRARRLVEWLALDEKATGRAVCVRQPTRADIPLAVQEQLIVELYSK